MRSRVFAAASETFSQRNINQSIDASLRGTGGRAPRAAGGVRVRGYLSTCFGCPFEGAVAVARVVELTERMLALGVFEVAVQRHDWRGAPGQVEQVLDGPAAARAARAARAALPRHARHGGGQRAGRRCRSGSRCSTPRPAGSAAAPSRRAPPATSRPRTCCTCSRPRHRRPACRSPRVIRVGGHRAHVGHPLPSRVLSAEGPGPSRLPSANRRARLPDSGFRTWPLALLPPEFHVHAGAEGARHSPHLVVAAMGCPWALTRKISVLLKMLSTSRHTPSPYQPRRQPARSRSRSTAGKRAARCRRCRAPPPAVGVVMSDRVSVQRLRGRARIAFDELRWDDDMGCRLRDGPVADHLEQQLDRSARDLLVGLVDRSQRRVQVGRRF